VLDVSIKDVERGDHKPEADTETTLDKHEQRKGERGYGQRATVQYEHAKENRQTHQVGQRLENVLTTMRVAGAKFGRRSRSRLLVKRPPADPTELLNQVHGNKALRTKAG